MTFPDGNVLHEYIHWLKCTDDTGPSTIERGRRGPLQSGGYTRSIYSKL